MVSLKNIMSCDIDDVIPGKISDLTRTAKIRRKYYWIFIKSLEYLCFSTSLWCIVFGENRNTLSIQDGGLKFAKFAYFSKIS